MYCIFPLSVGRHSNSHFKSYLQGLVPPALFGCFESLSSGQSSPSVISRKNINRTIDLQFKELKVDKPSNFVFLNLIKFISPFTSRNVTFRYIHRKKKKRRKTNLEVALFSILRIRKTCYQKTQMYVRTYFAFQHIEEKRIFQLPISIIDDPIFRYSGSIDQFGFPQI